MLQALNPYVRRIPIWLVYVVGAIPATFLAFGIYAAFTGAAHNLGADPLATLEHQTGIWSLRFLIAALCVTPILRIFRLSLVKYRRALGLLGFYYAMFHLGIWVWLDHWFDWQALLAEIIKRPYITIGMLAFTILLPLAVTSNDYSIRRIRAEVWRRIRWWAYPATAFGAIHFLLVVKEWPPEPIIYCGIVAVLLVWRMIRAYRMRPKNRPVARPAE